MEECKSPEAEALVAAAVRGPNQAASAAARVEAHAAVDAVQAGVDKRRAEALADVQAESEGRRAEALAAVQYFVETHLCKLCDTPTVRITGCVSSLRI